MLITALALPHGGKILFAATESGVVRCYKYPLTGEHTSKNESAPDTARALYRYPGTPYISGSMPAFQMLKTSSTPWNEALYTPKMGVSCCCSLTRPTHMLVTPAGEFYEVKCHEGPVARLRVSYDDFLLVSAGEDGSVVMLDIRDKELAKASSRQQQVNTACPQLG